MKKLFLILIFSIILYQLMAQPEPRKYKFTAQIEQELKEGKLRSSMAGFELSCVGAYQKALQMDDLDLLTRLESYREKENLTKVEIEAFNNYSPVSAIRYISQQANNQQIIILNESHTKPLHRVFVELLLDSLYQAGFRYVGLETLNMGFDTTNVTELDTLLNKRGYPFSNAFSTGGYTCEPQFGNFIRAAIQKGFHVFGYEATGPQRKTMSRDSAEALNVRRILQQKPQAKMLLFCGLSHLLEQPQPCPPDNPDCKQRLWMAYYLKNLTGIDPFTINQEILTERAAIPENPYYKLIKSNQPSVFVNKNGKAFNGPEGLDLFDVMVYHPRTKYVQGRPDWLTRNGKFKYYILKSADIKIDCPCQIRAYYENEPEAATPADIIEIATKDEQKALVLPPGNYNVVLENESGTLQRLKITVK